MLKVPPPKSLDLHFLVIKCHCWTYDDDIGPKLKKPIFAILGIYHAYPIVDLFSYFITFSNILMNAPLLDLSWSTEKRRPNNLRGGAFSICHCWATYSDRDQACVLTTDEKTMKLWKTNKGTFGVVCSDTTKLDSDADSKSPNNTHLNIMDFFKYFFSVLRTSNSNIY